MSYGSVRSKRDFSNLLPLNYLLAHLAAVSFPDQQSSDIVWQYDAEPFFEIDPWCGDTIQRYLNFFLDMMLYGIKLFWCII